MYLRKYKNENTIQACCFDLGNGFIGESFYASFLLWRFNALLQLDLGVRVLFDEEMPDFLKLVLFITYTL